MDSNLRREIILENYQEPLNRGLVEDESYLKVNTNSESCIDNLDFMMKIENAGAIFLGEYSSEPLGDYFAGPNHVLPTNGTAKFFSPLSVDDFVKKSSIIYYSKEALEEVHEDVVKFATSEHLTAHANSIAVRFEKK